MRSHVSPKISRLAELTVTNTAVVRPRMVMHDTLVLLQSAVKFELGRAIWTEIRILFTVYLAYMNSQAGQQFEWLAALRTCKWPFVSMFKDDVPPQQAGPLETSSTLTANMRTKIKVHFLVRVPSTCLSKRFAADTTRIRPFAGVRSHMFCQVCYRRTSTSTHAANKRLVFTSVVLAHVLIEKFHFPILLIAPGARMPLGPMGRVLVKS